MMVKIVEGADVFTLINTFHCNPANQSAIVASLRAFTDQVTSSMPGYVGVAVHASSDGTRVVNYVQWRDGAAMQAMRRDPRAEAHMSEVAALADRIEPVVYTIAFVDGAE